MNVTAEVKLSQLEHLKAAIAAAEKSFREGARQYAGVRIGIFEDATNNENGQKVAFYAACNEFGTERIPARPFMRITASKNAEKWGKVFRKAFENVEPSGVAAALRTAFTRIGIVGRNDMQETILSNVPPPNSPATAARKRRRAQAETESGAVVSGYTGTLVDTAAMYHAVGYRIIDSEGNYVDGQSA